VTVTFTDEELSGLIRMVEDAISEFPVYSNPEYGPILDKLKAAQAGA
jgi:hypothetical protein